MQLHIGFWVDFHVPGPSPTYLELRSRVILISNTCTFQVHVCHVCDTKLVLDHKMLHYIMAMLVSRKFT